jgi:hypothetical protein
VKAKRLVLISLFSLISMAAYAAPVLTIGTPADSYLATPTSPDPLLGGQLINFDNLTPGTTCGPSGYQYSFSGVPQATISSPDGLTVLPFSTQSAPNELFDNGANGTANISIKLTFNTDQIAVGIADSDPVTLTLQALDAAGAGLGNPFSVTIDNSGANPNPGNGYFVIRDTSPDIWGLQILQTSADPNNSGLAIDDVQFAPEPASLAMFAFGGLLIAGFKLRKRA